jgi:hypothetical protein
LKNHNLATETQNVCNDIDPNTLSHQDLVCWFFFMRHALARSKRKFLQLKDEHEVSLNQQKAHNASLQLSLKQTSSIQDLKKFENHAIQNSVIASNMRIILLEMAFPLIEVSVDDLYPTFLCPSILICVIYSFQEISNAADARHILEKGVSHKSPFAQRVFDFIFADVETPGTLHPYNSDDYKEHFWQS